MIKFLHQQGGPGQQHNGCFYRTCDGRKSALGSLIPDDLYTDGLEDFDPADLPRYIFDALDADTDEDIAFLVAMEAAHNAAARNISEEGTLFWQEWTSEVEQIAKSYSISLDRLRALDTPHVSRPAPRPPIRLARLGKPALICATHSRSREDPAK